MKCIKNNEGEIKRVSDRDAWERVKRMGWVYIPKSEWKALRPKVVEKVKIEVDPNLSIEEKRLQRRKGRK